MDHSEKKVAVITGCSKGGIGDALAREFHDRGIRVLATGRTLQKLSHLRDLGIEVIELDVESTESIRAAAETVNSFTGGRLDFLVNNSGSGRSPHLGTTMLWSLSAPEYIIWRAHHKLITLVTRLQRDRFRHGCTAGEKDV